ncbi:hypothetical protein HOD29_04160 [archaeon]|jgi:hypothetical protein|nr:hypothetical protein [archaeon]
MKFQFYHEKLIDSKDFQKFTKENPTAYACSGFFVLDKEKNENKFHIDFYLPKPPKMFSFKLDGKTEILPIENFSAKIPEKLGMNYTFDLLESEKLIIEEMKKQNVKGKITKLLFSLQKLNGKDYLLVTVFLSNMGLLKIQLDIAENKITDFQKKSFLDMIKIVKGNRKKE